METILKWLGIARTWLTKVLLWIPRVLKVIDTAEEELKNTKPKPEEK